MRAQLGPPRYLPEDEDRTPLAGVATGLAVTAFGGEILDVEAAWVKGSGRLRLTGQLGAVMRESAQAALSYVRSRASAYGVSSGKFAKRDLHVHVQIALGELAGRDAVSGGARAHVRERGLRRFAHDCAQLTRQAQPAAALHPGRLHIEDLAAKRRHRQPGRHTRQRGPVLILGQVARRTELRPHLPRRYARRRSLCLLYTSDAADE